MEKTRSEDFRLGTIQKHLHGRGEDPVQVLTGLEARGNTSTDVEKTAELAESRADSGKHLHGRGEDPTESRMI